LLARLTLDRPDTVKTSVAFAGEFPALSDPRPVVQKSHYQVRHAFMRLYFDVYVCLFCVCFCFVLFDFSALIDPRPVVLKSRTW
jgi:hypothetical protein